MKNKANSKNEMMEEYICKDDFYYEEIIVEHFNHDKNLKGGESKHEIQG